MEFLEVISRWVHIGTAIVLVGGSVFMRFVLMPAASDLPEDQHLALKARIMGRWKHFVHNGVLLFIMSGAYNYMKAMPTHKGMPLYHALIGTKIILAMVVFFLVSVLVGKSPKFEFMRQNSKKWILITITLAAIIVGISGYARVRLVGIPVPPEQPMMEEDILEESEGEAPAFGDEDSSSEDDAPAFDTEEDSGKDAPAFDPN